MTYPALEVLFGAYLNQDMFEDYANAEAAIQDFVSDHEDLREQAIGELVELLAHTSDDHELEIIALDLGLAVRSSGLSQRAWLNQISDYLAVSTS